MFCEIFGPFFRPRGRGGGWGGGRVRCSAQKGEFLCLPVGCGGDIAPTRCCLHTRIRARLGDGGWAAAPLQPLVPVAFCALGHPSNLPKTSHGHGRDSQVSTEVHAVQGLETALPFRRAVTASAYRLRKIVKVGLGQGGVRLNGLQGDTFKFWLKPLRPDLEASGWRPVPT